MAATSSVGSSSHSPVESFSTSWKENTEILTYSSLERKTYNEALREELVHLSERVDHLVSQVNFILLETCKSKAKLSRLQIQGPEQIARQEDEIQDLSNEIVSLKSVLQIRSEQGSLEHDSLLSRLNQSTEILWQVQAFHHAEVTKIAQFVSEIASLCGETIPFHCSEIKLSQPVQRIIIDREPSLRNSLFDRPYGLLSDSTTIRYAIAPETPLIDGSHAEDAESAEPPRDLAGWKPSESVDRFSTEELTQYNTLIHTAILKLQTEISHLLEEMDEKNKDLQPICDEMKRLQNQLSTALQKKEGILNELKEERSDLKAWIEKLSDRMVKMRFQLEQEIADCQNEIEAIQNGTRQLRASAKAYLNAFHRELLTMKELL
jgi:predicted  nucleic acid-binding Zn-ribbon protein